MLATILKGENAIRATLMIIETFAKVKELSRNINSNIGYTRQRQKTKGAIQSN